MIDHQVITKLLQRAGREILLPGLQKRLRIETKSDGSFVTEADLACQAFLSRELGALTPGIAFLGEEMDQEEQRQLLESRSSFWCVDPLDGTSNFTTFMPFFAISIALMEQGEPVFAAVYDPVRDESFMATKGEGCQLNQHPVREAGQKSLNDAVGFIDFKRLDRGLATRLVVDVPYRSQRNMGSCALEWAWLAAGRADFIIHGGEKPWDYAAGALLATEAGCCVSDFCTKPLFHGHHGTRSIVAASSPSLHQQWMTFLRET